MDETAPDVRDRAPEHVRAGISSAFAAVIARGLEKRMEARFQTVDEMATALHGCLVQRGEEMYSAFISYRVFSEKFHAHLLYEVLNNTITPGGHRVIVYLDAKRLVGDSRLWNA
jgi:predicted kinase